jgi:hypothetical protein
LNSGIALNIIINQYYSIYYINFRVGVPLPDSDSEGGPRYFLIRPGALSIHHKILDSIKVSTMISDIQLLDDDNWIIAGQVGILDLSNVTREHLAQLDPVVIKKITMMSQDMYPVEVIGVCIIKFTKQ